MATVYSLVCENGSAGTYWSGLTAAQKLRYGPVGLERVYGGLEAWYSARTAAGVGAFDVEVCEIGDAFEDVISSEIIISLVCDSIYITSKINGVRSAAFHGGVVGAGYRLKTSTTWQEMIKIFSRYTTIDGISFNIYNGGGTGIRTEAPFLEIKNNIIYGRAGQSSIGGMYIYDGSVACNIANNLVLRGSARGIRVGTYDSAQLSKIYNNTVAQCNQGISANTANFELYNNVCFDNTDDYYGTISTKDSTAALYNAGPAGSAPFDTGTTAIETVTSSDFVNSGNDDYRLASSSSLIGAGMTINRVNAIDQLDSPRPNYNPDGEEEWDIGCYEYDHGNGLAPTAVTVEIDGMIEGSVMAIYNSSTGAEIVAPTTIGATGKYTDSSFVYTADVPVNVVVRKATSPIKYLPYNAMGTIGSNGLSITVSQVEDAVA